MWNRQDEPKVSPAAPKVVAPSSQPVAPSQSATPQSSQSFSQQPATNVAPSAVPTAHKAAVSVVCKGISIKGQVTGSEDLQIDGEVQGTVELAGSKVMIGPEGKVTGNIHAKEIVVRGELKGNLRASDRIFVGQTARWEGDSVSPRVAIEEGAVVSGKIEVAQVSEKKAAQSNIAKPASAPVAAEPRESKPANVSAPAANVVPTAVPVLAAQGNEKSL
jgi:cytoskeletal protein CcmA (bactofilin family)